MFLIPPLRLHIIFFFCNSAVWESAAGAVLAQDKEAQIHVQQVWQHHTGVSECESRNFTQDGDEARHREYFVLFVMKICPPGFVSARWATCDQITHDSCAEWRNPVIFKPCMMLSGAFTQISLLCQNLLQVFHNWSLAGKWRDCVP